MQVEDAKKFIKNRILQLADQKQASNKVTAVKKACHAHPFAPAVSVGTYRADAFSKEHDYAG